MTRSAGVRREPAAWWPATGLLLLGIAPFGVAATGDALREGQRNGTATEETQIISSAAETGGAPAATRRASPTFRAQRRRRHLRLPLDRRDSGRTRACAPTTSTTGSAFEFNATERRRRPAASPQALAATPSSPFTTNATGVATGLNADRVDGQERRGDRRRTARAKSGLDADTVDGQGAGELTTRWALVDEAGHDRRSRPAASRPLTATRPTPTATSTPARMSATTASTPRSRSRTTTRSRTRPSSAARTGTAPCGAPPSSPALPPAPEDNEVLVVAPRQSDGAAAAAGARLRFYVYVTGSQAG